MPTTFNYDTMGSIKQTYLKRVAIKLLRDYAGEFKTDFDFNKKKVQEFTDITSKGIRNKIAGYITRAMNRKVKKEKAEAAEAQVA